MGTNICHGLGVSRCTPSPGLEPEPGGSIGRTGSQPLGVLTVPPSLFLITGESLRETPVSNNRRRLEHLEHSLHRTWKLQQLDGETRFIMNRSVLLMKYNHISAA